MRKNTFLTTTLPYVNSTPHIGHALEFVLGDVIARRLRTTDSVLFNIGIDEHGTKVFKVASEKGMTPQHHCDDQYRLWTGFCDTFNISYDTFYRTSSASHHRGVSHIWNTLMESGHLYQKDYTGTYCPGCESFKTSKELIDGRCPDHPGSEIETVTEKNWFFRMSGLRDRVIEHLKENPGFLVPERKYQELLNLLENYEDISVSRPVESCPWGIPVPGDPSQVIHVWAEALCNYILVQEERESDRQIQLCGPDNIRFQGGFYQGILTALDLPLTDTLLVHGTVLDKNGQKMSKSTGNTVCPMEQVSKWGIDAVRYHLVVGLDTTANSSWDENRVVEKFNSDLCDDWGNLVARTLHLCDLKGCGDSPEKGFKDYVDGEISGILHTFDELDIHRAYVDLNHLVKFGNRYINQEKPWSSEVPGLVLSNLLYLLKEVNEVYSYVIPDTTERARDAIRDREKVILFNKLTLQK